MAASLRIGIDTGGTFTDFVVARSSRITSFKLPSTPHNPAEAILAGVQRILAETNDALAEIVHGTTVATNALLERKGARTALVTTAGFEDVIEIGRQHRPEIYNFMVTRPAPLVPSELRYGITERIAADGSALTPLDLHQLQTLAKEITRRKVESVAVCLLFSFANPEHEQRIAAALETTGLPISLSHRILPEYREYERTSTVVINAYLVPIMSRYLNRLAEELLTVTVGQQSVGRVQKTDRKTRTARAMSKEPPSPLAALRQQPTMDNQRRTTDSHLRVMQSNGGSVSAATAAAEPVRAILSGPAGGVVGALRVCALAGIRDIITFDMGGTSTDVALCRGAARTTNEALVAGLPVAVPIIDIHTVGAGGGSIAHLDEAGALRVGPQSAGADPGPACYGRGEEVTVTDANLLLGRFGGDRLLGGEMLLDRERARFYLRQLAQAMARFNQQPVTTEQAALGVIRVANANMERALRVVSVERGQDPRLFTLVTFGGAGGLHVCDLAEALRIPQVLVPSSPGTLSALGVLLGDVVKDYSRTVMLKTGELNAPTVERIFAELEKGARRDLLAEGFAKDRIRLARFAALRYVGQSFEIDVAWNARFAVAFHQAHNLRYGYADTQRATEIVSLRVKAMGITDKPRLRRAASSPSGKAQPVDFAPVYVNERTVKTPIYQRDELPVGAKIKGPAILIEYSSTTMIPPGWKGEVDEWQNVIVTGDRFRSSLP